jgi:hypothetical protein
MLSDASIKEVWCEAHDDVTLILQVLNSEEVEFVQVKGNEYNQLWSITLLCQQDAAVEKEEEEKGGKKEKKSGTSIIERSLSRHCCCEPCRFRIVTALPPMDDLKPLTFSLQSEERLQFKVKLENVCKTITAKIGNALSPNGGDVTFWVSRTVWEIVYSIGAVAAKNLVALDVGLEKLGHILLNGQREELYQKLVAKMSRAGEAPLAAEKKIRRSQLLSWLSETVAALTHPGSLGGETMAEKMELAELPADAIVAAHELRNSYRLRTLKDRYSAPLTHATIEAEIVARLNTLRAHLDVGEYADNGPLFHQHCLDSLGDLYQTSPDAQKLGLAFLHGCMYSITDRCGHRFRRVTP